MKPSVSDDISREEFETFLRAFTHEIRNRLNSISLEAADLAEQVGSDADASRLQGQIQDCSAFLKAVRDLLASDSPQKGKVSPAEAIKKWREGKIGEMS
jgi:signal transduction histidine kinase